MRKMLTLVRLRVKRLWHTMFLVAGVATAAAWGWWHFDVLGITGDETAAYDDGIGEFTNKEWFPWGQSTRSQDIVIVAIDDATFSDVAAFGPWRDRYGSWPYDRIIWSDVLEYLDQAGARLVVFDATLDEPKSDVGGDIKLGETIGKVRVPFHLGFNVVPTAAPLPEVETPVNRLAAPAPPDAGPPRAAKGKAAEEDFPSDDFPGEDAKDPEAAAKERQEKADAILQRAAQAYAFPVEAVDLEIATFSTAEELALPDGGVATGEDIANGVDLIKVPRNRNPAPAIEPLLDVVSGFGSVGLEPDDDGKMRRTAFLYTDGTNNYATLSVGAAADWFKADKVTWEPGKLHLGDHVVRINKDGSAEINYGGNLADRFVSVPLVDVLRYKVKKTGYERFKGKLVIIAGFALGTADVKATPFEAQVPGVMKQASELDNLIHDRFIIEAPFWVSLLVALFVALLSVLLVMVVQSVVTDIGAPVFLYFFFFTVTGCFLTLTHWHVLSAMASMAGTLASVAATAFNRFFASKERDFLRQAFSSYMEEDLVDQMVEGHQLPSLSGEERVVTAFFSDIRGFSTFSEALREEPRRLMSLLNRYLSTLTPVIKAQGGCLDKYIGDSVVALFGAPVHHDNHPLLACKAALEVQRVVGVLRAQLAKEGLPDVYTRIGLNTDKMLVGNIGSDDLLDYTALGDGMNLASRLEGVNKVYGTLILMGPQTYDAVRDHVVAREVDTVRVAGKHQPIHIYELLGLPGDVGEATLQACALYKDALELYRGAHFKEALETLARALRLVPDDGPSLTLGARCKHNLEQPPPPDWDGVTSLEK